MQTWIAIAGITIAAYGLAFAPLLRRREPVIDQRYKFDISVYRAQMEEVERDLARGLLSADRAEAALTETKRRILAAGGPGGGNGGVAAAEWSSRPLAALLAAVLSVAALGLYGQIGSPDMPDLSYAEAQANRLNLAEDQSRQVLAMVDRLVERMKTNPNDVPGWQTLGRSYTALGRTPEAIDAYRRAISLGASDSETLSAMAELAMRNAGGTITAEALPREGGGGTMEHPN